MMKMMTAIGKHLDGEAPKDGDVFGFRFADAVATVEFTSIDGDMEMKVTVAPIIETFDEKMYEEADE